MPTIVDCHSRESLVVEPRASFKAAHIVEAPTRLVRSRGAPGNIRCDIGPEFISRVLDQQAAWNKVQRGLSRPDKPTDNALIESFNGRLRQECLNGTWFVSLADAAERLEAWTQDCKELRPHTSLGNLTSNEYVSTRHVIQAGSAEKIA